MSKFVTICKSCKRELEISDKHKKCVNLGCTEYNKKLRRYDANRKKRQKEKIQCKEEE